MRRHSEPSSFPVSVVALAALAAAACVRSAPEPVAPVLSTCAVPSTDSPERPWRQVVAPNFSFCVPPDWHPADSRPFASARTWSRGRDTLSWWPAPSGARALLPPEYEGRDPATLASPNIRQPLRPENRPLGERDTHTYSCTPTGDAIDTLQGRHVELTRALCGTRYHTTAFWPTENLRFVGTASTPAVSRLHLVVYRTVRFMDGPPPNSTEPD